MPGHSFEFLVPPTVAHPSSPGGAPPVRVLLLRFGLCFFFSLLFQFSSHSQSLLPPSSPSAPFASVPSDTLTRFIQFQEIESRTPQPEGAIQHLQDLTLAENHPVFSLILQKKLQQFLATQGFRSGDQQVASRIAIDYFEARTWSCSDVDTCQTLLELLASFIPVIPNELPTITQKILRSWPSYLLRSTAPGQLGVADSWIEEDLVRWQFQALETLSQFYSRTGIGTETQWGITPRLSAAELNDTSTQIQNLRNAYVQLSSQVEAYVPSDLSFDAQNPQSSAERIEKRRLTLLAPLEKLEWSLQVIDLYLERLTHRNPTAFLNRLISDCTPGTPSSPHQTGDLPLLREKFERTQRVGAMLMQFLDTESFLPWRGAWIGAIHRLHALAIWKKIPETQPSQPGDKDWGALFQQWSDYAKNVGLAREAFLRDALTRFEFHLNDVSPTPSGTLLDQIHIYEKKLASTYAPFHSLFYQIKKINDPLARLQIKAIEFSEAHQKSAQTKEVQDKNAERLWRLQQAYAAEWLTLACATRAASSEVRANRNPNLLPTQTLHRDQVQGSLFQDQDFSFEKACRGVLTVSEGRTLDRLPYSQIFEYLKIEEERKIMWPFWKSQIIQVTNFALIYITVGQSLSLQALLYRPVISRLATAQASLWAAGSGSGILLRLATQRVAPALLTVAQAATVSGPILGGVMRVANHYMQPEVVPLYESHKTLWQNYGKDWLIGTIVFVIPFAHQVGNSLKSSVYARFPQVPQWLASKNAEALAHTSMIYGVEWLYFSVVPSVIDRAVDRYVFDQKIQLYQGAEDARYWLGRSSALTLLFQFGNLSRGWSAAKFFK